MYPYVRPSLLLAAFVLAASCADPQPDPGAPIPTYDPATGKLTRLASDLNGNGTPDAFTYMDGTRVLRSEIDADEDGKIEKWEFHGADGKVERVAVSRENNGTADTWMYPGPDGKLARAEISSEQDPEKIDRWEWYENDQVVRAEEDASGDGKVDKWETFEAGVLVSVMLDEDDDGRPDRRLTYGEGGRLLTIESEPDGQGGYRKKVKVDG